MTNTTHKITHKITLPMWNQMIDALVAEFCDIDQHAASAGLHHHTTVRALCERGLAERVTYTLHGVECSGLRLTDRGRCFLCDHGAVIMRDSNVRSLQRLARDEGEWAADITLTVDRYA